MCCTDGLRQTFGRHFVPDHERPLCARSGPSSDVAFDPEQTFLLDLRIIRLIQKWLKAGVLENGVVTVSEKGR
jgi:hypothetical protein